MYRTETRWKSSCPSFNSSRRVFLLPHPRETLLLERRRSSVFIGESEVRLESPEGVGNEFDVQFNEEDTGHFYRVPSSLLPSESPKGTSSSRDLRILNSDVCLTDRRQERETVI